MTTALVILHDMYYKLPNVNQTMENSVSAAEGGQVPLTDWMGAWQRKPLWLTIMTTENRQTS